MRTAEIGLVSWLLLTPVAIADDPPSFGVRIVNPDVSIAVGQEQVVRVAVDRGKLAGPVVVVFEELPAGVTAMGVVIPEAQSDASLRITVGPHVPPITLRCPCLAYLGERTAEAELKLAITLTAPAAAGVVAAQPDTGPLNLTLARVAETVTRGEEVSLGCVVISTSDQELDAPNVFLSDRKRRNLGVVQTWIECVQPGPWALMKYSPHSSREGNRVACGGSIASFMGARIPVRAEDLFHFTFVVETADLLPGKYRCTAEFEPTMGLGSKQAAKVEFQVVANKVVAKPKAD